MTTADPPDPPPKLPLYAVCDRRRDGRLRVLQQFTEPKQALEHARMLRWSGAAAEVLLVSRLDPDPTP